MLLLIVNVLHSINYIHNNSIVIIKRNIVKMECGTHATTPKAPRINGGDEAMPNSWPWQVLLRCTYTDKESSQVLPESDSCRGSIISENWVITAARCM